MSIRDALLHPTIGGFKPVRFCHSGVLNPWRKRPLQDLVLFERYADKDDVLRYMHAGTILLAGFAPAHDPFAPRGAKVPLCSIVEHTDGVWLWSTAMAQCVARYDVKLPDAFLERVRMCHYHPTPVPEGPRGPRSTFPRAHEWAHFALVGLWYYALGLEDLLAMP